MITTMYPVLITKKIQESCTFYKNILGFTETFSGDRFISLSHPDGGALALMDNQHETIPETCRATVEGMVLNVEVEDATQAYEDISGKAKQMIAMSLRDEEYGQRHFMVKDPNGVIVDIIENILPNEEFKGNYRIV